MPFLGPKIASSSRVHKSSGVLAVLNIFSFSPNNNNEKLLDDVKGWRQKLPKLIIMIDFRRKRNRSFETILSI